jgi:preprotein translocase subunit SecA
VREYVPPESVEEQWDLPALERRLESDFFLVAPVHTWAEQDQTLDAEKIAARVIELANAQYVEKFAPVDSDVAHQYERAVMLQSIDQHWREHLAALDYLRQGIHLRGYAQKQPKQEYKREAFELFSNMLDSIKREVTQHLMAVQIRSQEQVEEAERKAEEAAQALKNVQYHHADYDEALAGTPPEGGEVAAASEPAQPFVRPGQKVGRNDPCPCGSGKKYKNCHGKLA